MMKTTTKMWWTHYKIVCIYPCLESLPGGARAPVPPRLNPPLRFANKQQNDADAIVKKTLCLCHKTYVICICWPSPDRGHRRSHRFKETVICSISGCIKSFRCCLAWLNVTKIISVWTSRKRLAFNERVHKHGIYGEMGRESLKIVSRILRG